MNHKRKITDVSSRLPLVISTSVFKGKNRLDIRHFFPDDAGSLLPTPKGVNIPLEDLPILLASLQAFLDGNQD